MADLNKKFSIDSWDEWFVVSKWVDNQIQATEEELLNQLVELPDSFLAKLQDKKLANKKEQFEQLKPAWFEHASQKAKKYRQELEANEFKEMKKLLKKWSIYKRFLLIIQITQLDCRLSMKLSVLI